MSDRERVQVNHEVPEEYRRLAQRKTEHGEMSERVRDIYKQAAYPNDVDDREDIDERLRELRGECDQLKLERRRAVERLDAEIDSKEKQIARLEERKDAARSKADQFEGALAQLVTHVENGGHIWETYPGVEQAAETIGESPEFVIEKVRERAPGTDKDQFEQGSDIGGRR